MSPPSSILSFVMFRCLRRRRPGSHAACNRCGVYTHFWWLITRASSGCAVRWFRCLLRWRVLVALIKETGVFVWLRLRLRRDARHRRPPPTPATDARHRRPPPPPTPARSHDPSWNPRAMPGVVPEFPSKHPRQTAVVLTAKRGRAAFWSASCCIFCASPRLPTTAGLVLALAGQIPPARTPRGWPPFAAVRPCKAITEITAFLLVQL